MATHFSLSFLRIIAFTFVFLFSNGTARADEKSALPKRLPNFKKPLWKRATILDPNDYTGNIIPEEKKAHSFMVLAKKIGMQQNHIPGSFPVIRDTRCINRTPSVIRAINLKNINLKEIALKLGAIFWQTVEFDNSLPLILSSPVFNFEIGNWLKRYQIANSLPLVYQNEMTGCFSMDKDRVYAIDSFAVPYPNIGQGIKSKRLKSRLELDSLIAIELSTGKLKWQLGRSNLLPNDPFQPKSHFLGPPLPYQGKLYCLNEKHMGKIRFACLDPESGTVKWMIDLGKPNEPIYNDILRRVNPIYMIGHQNRILFTDHSGKFYAIDIKAKKKAWEFVYRKAKRKSPYTDIKTFLSAWKRNIPIVVKDKVIFTAADDDPIYCLNLKNGNKIWKTARKKALYLAGVFNNRLYSVEPKTIRLLSIKKGEEKAIIQTGIPSGVGSVHKGYYFLPLRKGIESNKGELCCINLKNNKITRLLLPKNEALGNLAVNDNYLVSQDATTITAYPTMVVPKRRNK